MTLRGSFKAAQFKAAIEAGKHVFIEKPVAVDGPTARIMYVHGSKGMADLYDGRNIIKPKDGQSWPPTGITNDNGYVNEHVDLIKAIINGTELNETKNVTDSTLTAIMGREAAYSGAAVEWDQILNSGWKYGPEPIYGDLTIADVGRVPHAQAADAQQAQHPQRFADGDRRVSGSALPGKNNHGPPLLAGRFNSRLVLEN